MIDKQVSSVAEALAGLGDGASVMIGGFGGVGFPVSLLRGIEAAGVRGLTIVCNSLRYIHTYAPLLFDDGRVARVVCSAARGQGAEPQSYERQWADGRLDVEIVPQGSFVERIRAGGAGVPAFYTPTGVGTEIASGKEVRTFGGRPCVLETAITADFAIFRAHAADRWGNLTFLGSQANFSPALATAARVTAVEVDEVRPEPIPPRLIDVSGIHVKRVIALPDQR